MLSTLRKSAVAAAIIGFSSAASATYIPMTWEDTFTPASAIELDRNNRSYEFTHDITDDGFDVDSDWALGYSLSVNLYDDRDHDKFLCLAGCEGAFLDLPGLISDRTVEVDYTDISAGWSILGLLSLNAFGTLDVDIKWVAGDFYFGGSNLTVHGKDFPNYPVAVTVPEPGTLALLGLGLVAVGVIRRRA